MNQRRRPAIQQMRVINEHHQRPPPAPVGYRPAVAAQQLTLVLPGQVITVGVRRQKRCSAPNGSPRDAHVAAARATGIPRSSATFNPAMARVVLPAPAAPMITAPRCATTAAVS
jgi:hypothetical protein